MNQPVALASISRNDKHVVKLVAAADNVEPVIKARGTDYVLSFWVVDSSSASPMLINLFSLHRQKLPSIKLGDIVAMYGAAVFYGSVKDQVTLFGKLNGKPQSRLQLRLFREMQQVWFCHLEEKVNQVDLAQIQRIASWYSTRPVSPLASVIMIPQGNSSVRPEPISSSSSSYRESNSTRGNTDKKRPPTPTGVEDNPMQEKTSQAHNKKNKTVIVLD